MTNREWLNSLFARAVQFEKDMQQAALPDQALVLKPFLHRSCQPLSQVDFRTDAEFGQGDLFGNECEGVCGV